MNRIPKYAKPAVDPPKIRDGELVPIDEITITDVEGDYGPQYQVDGLVRGTEFNARAWIKKYDDPTVKTKIVKLCILIEDEMEQEFETIGDALDALTTTISCLHFQCTGHRKNEDGPDYPKFSVNTGSFPVYDKTPKKQTLLLDKLRVQILIDNPAVTEPALDKMITEEITKANGLLTEEAATYLVSQNLGVKITS